MWLWIVLSILAAVAGLVGALLFRPVSYRVSRSTRVKRPVEEVFAFLQDFSLWREWSPWLCTEPKAKVQISGGGKKVGASYSWEGEVVGQGHLRHAQQKAPEILEMDLRFLKPYKSKARTGFKLATDGDGASVTWRMEGTLPFFIRERMSAWIGSDYERGLRMLKERMETGRVTSESKVEGLQARSALFYVGLEKTCPLSSMGPSLQGAMREVATWLERSEFSGLGPPFTLYRKFDPVAKECAYVVCLPVPAIIPAGKLPGGYGSGELPDHQAFSVTHRGSYVHLGNAWATGMAWLKAGKHKQRKDLAPYEVYLDDPEQVKEERLRTQVVFPVAL
ncbi:MAG: SRPBCC family protein [Verrucomicrobiota bacterium]